jgi:hypothetical protein
VPAGRGQAAQHRQPGRLLVEMHRLGIVFRREGDDRGRQSVALSILRPMMRGFVMPWRANVVNGPARDQRRAGSLVRCSAAPLLLHDDRRADLDPVIKIDHVLIGHANAAR